MPLLTLEWGTKAFSDCGHLGVCNHNDSLKSQKFLSDDYVEVEHSLVLIPN